MLTYEPARARLTLVRTSEPLDPATFGVEVEALVAAIADIDVASCGLFFDVRAVVGRNDDAFETASLAVRRRFITRFAKTAVLVKSLVGRLQGERFAREDKSGPRLLVTRDPEEAASFLGEVG